MLLKINKIHQTAYALNPDFVASLVLFATTFKTISEIFCRMSGATFDDATSHFELLELNFGRAPVGCQVVGPGLRYQPGFGMHTSSY